MTLQPFLRRGLARPAIRIGGGLIIAQATTVAAGVGVGTLLARALGVEGYGQYVFALAVVQVMLVPLNFGLPTLVMREVAVLRTRADWALLSGLLLWSAVVIAAVLAALAIGVTIWSKVAGVDALLFFFAVALAGAWAYLRLAAAVLRGMERVVLAAMPDQVIRPVMMLIGIVVLTLVMDLTPAHAMALHAFAAAAGLGWTLWILWSRSSPIPTDSSAEARYDPGAWLKSILPLGLQVGAGFLNSRIDVLMLGLLSDKSSVGVYGLAILIGGIATMPETLVKHMIAPRIARLHVEGRRHEIQRIAGLAALVSVAGALAVFAAILLVGGPIVAALVGSEFESSIRIAGVVAIASVITACWCSAGPLLNMTGHERVTARISWASAAANAVLNLALIPVLGALGAAMATGIVTAGRGIAFAIFAKRLVGVHAGFAHLFVKTETPLR